MSANGSNIVLQTDKTTIRFGGLCAVNELDMAVKKGDEVVTGGGIRGKVTKVSDEEAEVEIAQGVKVWVVKSTITQVLTPNAKPAND